MPVDSLGTTLNLHTAHEAIISEVSAAMFPRNCWKPLAPLRGYLNTNTMQVIGIS